MSNTKKTQTNHRPSSEKVAREIARAFARVNASRQSVVGRAYNNYTSQMSRWRSTKTCDGDELLLPPDAAHARARARCDIECGKPVVALSGRVRASGTARATDRFGLDMAGAGSRYAGAEIVVDDVWGLFTSSSTGEQPNCAVQWHGSLPVVHSIRDIVAGEAIIV